MSDGHHQQMWISVVIAGHEPENPIRSRDQAIAGTAAQPACLEHEHLARSYFRAPRRPRKPLSSPRKRAATTHDADAVDRIKPAGINLIADQRFRFEAGHGSDLKSVAWRLLSRIGGDEREREGGSGWWSGRGDGGAKRSP